MRNWQCKNCEHINIPSENSCEICGSTRAYFNYIKYELTDKHGIINISWDSINAEDVYFVKKKKKYKVDLSGSYHLSDCKHKEKIVFYSNNKIAENNEELTVLFEKPEIVFFELENTKLLIGGKSKIEWRVNNAERIKISEIGVVEDSGISLMAFKRNPITITAENEVGNVEKSILIDFIPSPVINFNIEKAKIEISESTKLSWDITNAVKVNLLYDEIVEEIPLVGKNEFSPIRSTTFKIVVTALDNTTIIEKEISVQVFEKPLINFFNAAPNVVLDCVPVTISWNVENAKKVVIDNGIGEVEMVGTKKTLLQKNKTFFTLTAYGELSNCTQDVAVRILPTPIIESLKIPMPDFTSRFSLSSVVLNPPSINVSINLPDFNFNMPEYVTPNIPLNRIKPEYKPKMSIFNFSKLYERISRKSKI